jgi:hypothetical protein
MNRKYMMQRHVTGSEVAPLGEDFDVLDGDPLNEDVALLVEGAVDMDSLGDAFEEWGYRIKRIAKGTIELFDVPFKGGPSKNITIMQTMSGGGVEAAVRVTKQFKAPSGPAAGPELSGLIRDWLKTMGAR